MSGAKHTPGPWRSVVREWGDHAVEARVPCINGLPAWVELANCGRAYPEDEMFGGMNYDANARLIAAAPELLEALEMCTKSMRSVLPDFNPFDQAAYDMGLVALAKAKGDTPC